MNKRIIIYILGWVLIVEGAAMQVCTVTSVIYREHEGLYFLLTGLISAAVGVVAVKFKKQKNMVLYQKAGFAATALSWILMSLVAALPFFLSGEIPNYLDAFFESVSGFTTTGASILTNVESLSHGMLLWRSVMIWLGGMGVIVFLLALIPKLGGQSSIFLMKAESPGPIIGKAVPKMRHYAAILYGIYIGLTTLEVILLLCGGMDFFNAVNVSFSTAGTGGFGIHNNNMAAYHTHYLQTVIAVFMMLFGVNFSVYILLIARKFKQALRTEELWFYLGFIVVSTIVIAVNILPLYRNDFGESLHQGFFYVSSIITTTGFGIGDVNHWPQLSKAVILVITFIGAMAGSTGGGFKVSRINTSVFMVVYVAVFVGSFLLVSIEGRDMVTSFTAVAATLNNTGPGLNDVGPVGNYYAFTPLSKIVLIIDMLAGRLEIFPLLLLFSPSAWKKN